MLDGDVTRSDSLSRVSVEAAFTFLMLITRADDFGRFDGRPRILLSELFPLREDVGLEALTRWLSELESEGLVHRYERNGRPYVHFPTWDRYQRLRKESTPKWPEPNGCCDNTDERGNPPQPAASRGPKGEAGSGKREAGSGKKRRKKPKSDPPDDLTPDDRGRVFEWAADVLPGRMRDAPDSIEGEIEDCLRWHRKNGVQRVDWADTAVDWIRRNENDRRERFGKPRLRSRTEARRLRKKVEEQGDTLL